ncbi:MAG TPA: hypothetical protein VFZ44_09270 [Pyrinomonadaceae bacterium]
MFSAERPAISVESHFRRRNASAAALVARVLKRVGAGKRLT